MDEFKLRPCPFCGGAAEIYVKKGFLGEILYVTAICKSCRASVAPFGTEEAAKKAWNSRVQERKENKEI